MSLPCPELSSAKHILWQSDLNTQYFVEALSLGEGRLAESSRFEFDHRLDLKAF